MLAMVRRILSFEMTVAEWIGTAVMLAIPYLLVGVIWSVINTDQLSRSHGAARVVSFLGSVASWPVLALTDICVTQAGKDDDMLSTADCRIHVSRCTARWDDRPVTAAEAMDFWSFAAAAANVVMQLAWPAVGYGVVESKVDSGSLMKHPWKRLRTTSQYLAVAVLGSDEDRAAFRDAVDVAHRDVKSTPDSPVRYNAFDRELQMWVAACLFVGLEDTYQLLRGEMTADQAEQFYRSAWTLGTTLQVTEDQWPTTREAFDAYWNTAAERVVIDEPVRRYLFDLLNLRMINPFLALPFRPLLKFLTAGFLAPVFRDALGVRWSDARQRWFERLFLLVAFANRFLPVFVRQGGSYVLLADVRRRVRRHKSLV